MDVFPALLEGDVPFYSHEIDAYWNDIGNLDELRQGNIDALRGEVEVDPRCPERSAGVRAGQDRSGRGRDRAARSCSAAGSSSVTACGSTGPAVIGDGVKIGRGARIADSVLLPEVEVEPGAKLSGEILSSGRRPPPAESGGRAGPVWLNRLLGAFVPHRRTNPTHQTFRAHDASEIDLRAKRAFG